MDLIRGMYSYVGKYEGIGTKFWAELNGTHSLLISPKTAYQNQIFSRIAI